MDVEANYDHSQIVNISFGLSNFSMYETLQEIEKIGAKGQKLRQQQQVMGNKMSEEDSKKIDEQCEKLLSDVVELGHKYKKQR